MRKSFDNDDPWMPWNDGMQTHDPFKPWNNEMCRDDPFAPWNDPLGSVEDYNRYCEREHISEWDR